MKSNPLTFEGDILSALRLPAFYKRWGRTLPVGVLSPHGQRVARAMQFSHKARPQDDAPLTAEDIVAVLRKDGPIIPGVKDLVMAVTKKGGPSLAIQAALAEEILKRSALEGLMQRATMQLQSGKIDLEALSTTLRSYRTGSEEVLRDFNAEEVALEGEGLDLLPTPWPRINEQILGLYPKELGMVMAVPKVGKTTMLLNLAVGALERGWHVLYITAADLGYGGINRRLAGVWLEQPSSTLRSNRKLLGQCEADWRKRGVRVAVADYSSRPCYLADLERVIEQVRLEQRDENLAVFIDRLEQTIPGDKSGDTRKDIEQAYATARMFANRYAVPIWVDSQAALKENDEGWVDLTRGAEARVAKAKIVDLAIGVGVHPEDNQTLRLKLSGRREIAQECLELRLNRKTGVVTE